MSNRSHGIDVANDLDKGTLIEVAIRVITPFDAPSHIQVVYRNRSGMAVISRAFPTKGLWSNAEIQDVINSVHSQLLTTLALTQGVQLTLSAE